MSLHAAAAPDTPPLWQRTWLLALLLFAAVLLNNSDLVFNTRLYEADDYAANSLQVLKAKHFAETLGNYCRFGFHHPGPAFFYVFGWGEILFHDLTRIVPTPFNGQLIALYALSAFFFGGTLSLVATKLSRPTAGWFLGLSLLFAVWHFGSASRFLQFIPGYIGFFTPWAPCFIVLPFLCFVIAAGSVAAGYGKDLPVMTLAGCFLVHGHVAMPLFVVPLTLIAYGFLFRETGRVGTRPWNAFRRQHWIAGATIAVFLGPIIINVISARPNNLALIIEHLRTSYGTGKTIPQSLFHFLHFGAYAAYPSQQPIPAFDTFDAAGLRSFFLMHWRASALWLGSVVLFIVATRSMRSDAQKILRRRLGLLLILAAGLSVFWGCVQEGPMFDYNALFNFAIYYGWLLLVALSLAGWIEDQMPLRIRFGALVTLLLAVTVTAGHERRRFRGTANKEEQRQFAAAIEQALVRDPVQPKFLNFDAEANSQAERVALFLQRREVGWWVREDWPLLFGEERIVRPGQTDRSVPTLASSFWRVALHADPPTTEGDANAIVLALSPGFDLVIHPGK
jgi:hypothetical protein